jgi:hypothetical protein
MVTALTNFKNTVALRWHSLDESWRYAITVFVIARILFGLWSWVVYTIQPVALQNFALRGEPILSVFKVKDSQRYIYRREINGTVLTFRPLGTDHIVDQQTQTIWNISTGEAVQGQYANLKLARAEKTKLQDIFPYFGSNPYPGLWLSMWQRFDANIYATIAEHGYGEITGDTHFPPFFPLLIALLKPVTGNAFLAGLFISYAATLFLLKLLYDAFTDWGGLETGKRAVLFFVIYPTFFFFFSAYSESVFIVCTLLALRTMKTRSWAWAGFWTFCAILTRLQGAALLVPMIYLMYRDPPFLRRVSHWFGLGIAGIGGLFYVYLRWLAGTVSVLPTVESEWQARLALPGESYLYAVKTLLGGHGTFIDLLNFLIATLFLVLLIAGWRRIPLEYNLFMVFNLLILSIRVVETQPLNSMLRFSLTLFPVFFTLSLAGKQPWVRRVIVYTSIPLALYLSGQFMIWGWVA